MQHCMYDAMQIDPSDLPSLDGIANRLTKTGSLSSKSIEDKEEIPPAPVRVPRLYS